jgi:geranylgeranyl transferase type-2 subunit alpha
MTANHILEFDLITRAIFSDAYPYAQSVWFYYQFLMTNLTNYVGHTNITPNLSLEDRAEYVLRQLSNLRDILDGAEDCKWTYIALLEYTVELCGMEERSLQDDEKKDCRLWLAEIRKLDPSRAGRWDDLEISLRKLGHSS